MGFRLSSIRKIVKEGRNLLCAKLPRHAQTRRASGGPGHARSGFQNEDEADLRRARCNMSKLELGKKKLTGGVERSDKRQERGRKPRSRLLKRQKRSQTTRQDSGDTPLATTAALVSAFFRSS